MTRNAFELSLPGGPSAVLAEMTCAEVLVAMRGAGATASRLAVRLEVVRHALRRVENREVRFTDVAGAQLVQLVPRTRHQFALGQAWGRIHEPDEADVEAVMASMACETGLDGERWTVALPGGRKVVLAERPAETVATLLERAQKANRGETLQGFAAILEALRASVVAVDGQAVTAAELDGKGWDQRFSVKETLLLGSAWQEIHVAVQADEVGELKPVSGVQ